MASGGTGLVLLVFASVVTTVAPTVAALHAGASGETWALSGMSLGLATMLLSLGAIADDYGRRRVFLLSLIALVGSSVMAAAAPGIEFFVVARILQGASGAGIVAASLGLIGHSFRDGPERTRATGVWGAAVGAGTALGPLTSAGLQLLGGWRAGYWLQAAGAVLLIPAGLMLAETRAPTVRRIDLPGAILFSGAMATLVAGLTLGRQDWGRASTIGLLLASVLLLGGFIVVERRRREPMIDLALFRRPLFLASATGALFVGLAVVAVVSFLPTFLQRALHQSLLASAGILALFSVAGTLVAFHVRRLPDRFDSGHRVAVGFVCGALGLAGISGLSPHSTWVRLAPGLILLGVGYGLANAALGRLAVESVPHRRTGMGSGANNTARYVGGAAGVAIIAALLAAGDDRPGAAGLAQGWNLASAVAAGLCLAGAAVALACRRGEPGARTDGPGASSTVRATDAARGGKS
ncbi:MAG: MFS transporter [Actinomycetota bacterium]|nr:MFS transporter [Actinomycetota bacterium]